MKCKKVDGKYRILFDGEHLPEEVAQDELDKKMSELRDAVSAVCNILHAAYEDHGVAYRIIDKAMSSACMDYQNGEDWHLNCLLHEIQNIMDSLQEGTDDVASYEDSETIFDVGYKEEWAGSGVYVLVLEDSSKQEIVKEIILKYGEPIYRKRATLWEQTAYGKSSKGIQYEDLPIDNETARLIRNTMRVYNNG